MSRGWSRERWAREVGTAILAGAILATIAGRPLRRLLRSPGARRRAMAEKKDPGLEGEGSRTAAQGYRKGVEEHLRRADVGEEAERAARELDEHPDEPRRAEEDGKRRSAGELEGDLER
jgi:hypothetical protein